MDNSDKVEDIYIKIKNAEDINALIGAYQIMLHNLRYLSALHLGKVKIFLNEFYIPTMSLSQILKEPKILDDFNKDPCYIIRLKNLLTDLNDYSQSRGGSHNYLTLKSDKNG